ncbi:hypothetical protein ACPFL9_20385 [Paenarthrobacter sp. NyZ202]|uniref:hypothetical protein n=1 Tax=Paenarthrobacter sp. NyZ202 TaxID=3402689 RepID=UPI003CF89D31
MILTGTITTTEDQYDYISAEGATYEEARAKLDALLAVICPKPLIDCHSLLS